MSITYVIYPRYNDKAPPGSLVMSRTGRESRKENSGNAISKSEYNSLAAKTCLVSFR